MFWRGSFKLVSNGSDLQGAEDGKPSSITQDMSRDASLGWIISNPGEGSNDVCSLVDVCFEGGTHGDVEPGAHGSAVCDVVDRRLYRLANRPYTYLVILS